MSDEESTALTEALTTPRPDFPTLTCAMGCGEPECGMIFRAGATCPNCGSSALLNLASILSPKEVPAC